MGKTRSDSGGFALCGRLGAAWGNGLVLVLTVAALAALASSTRVAAAVDQWTSIGPDGGRVFSVGLSPTYPTDRTLLVGTSDGVFKSTSGGTSWREVNAGLTNTTIHSVCLSPTFPTDQTVYVGTNAGVHRSTDSGESWTEMNAGLPLNPDVESVAVSPDYASDRTVFAGTWGSGVFSSTNGGESWSDMNAGLSCMYIYAIGFSPDYSTDRTIVVGTTEGVFKSTDGGATWHSASSGLTNTRARAIAFSPNYANDRTLFVGAIDHSVSGGVFKSSDGGASWTNLSSGLGSTDVYAVMPLPTYATDQTLLAGTNGGVFVSTNGGADWAESSSGLTNAWVCSLVASPAFGADHTVFAGTMGGGVFRGALGAEEADPGASASYYFVTKWGSEGSADGQFSYPARCAVDAAGNLYVSEIYGHRIQKFDSSGAFLTKWGSPGTEDGQFQRPTGVALDSSGNVYVADESNYRIQKFDSGGAFLTKWGSQGTGDGQFSQPSAVAVDSSGNIYVVDVYGHRIQKFDSDGNFLAKWGSFGSGDGQFNCPVGIAADASGNVYVSDYYNYRIQKFDSDGTFLAKWGSQGEGDGQFAYPLGLAIDSSGNVFAADVYNSRIQKFDSNGVFLTKWGSYGSGDGEFWNPTGVAVDSSGDVYVVDQDNHRIQKFRPTLEQPSPTDRVSVSSEEIEGNAASSVRTGSTSADGRWVAFTSYADNLVPGDSNQTRDVFVRDRQSGETERVSVSGSGTLGDAGNNGSYNPAISSDGRFVSFMSDATNLVPNDTNGHTDIFVHDRQAGDTSRVSISSAGAEGNGDSVCAYLSGDGRVVVFTSDAANLVPGDTNNVRDAFVHDRQTGETVRVNVSSEGAEAQGETQECAVSGDGRYVAFDSAAANLVPGDTNGVDDIFVRDRQTGETNRVSLTDADGQADGRSVEPAVSSDGQSVAFMSDATNLVSGDANGIADIFVRNTQTGETVRASVSDSGAESNGLSHVPAISDDGRFVAFASGATNMVPDDANGQTDVFVRDLRAHTTTLASLSRTGIQGNGASSYPSISGDGRTVAFWSYASNLVSNDTNGCLDVFARELGPAADSEPPSTASSADPAAPNGANGWYVTTPSVTLSSGEPGTTYYQWDSTDPLGWQPYLLPLIAPEGVHTLYYYSVDEADNVEVVKSETIKTDTITPVVNISSPAAETTVSGSVSVDGEASDANFASYSLSYGSGKRPLGDGTPGSWYQGTWWRSLTSSTSQVTGGTLATWSTTALDNSWHTLRVVAVDEAGNTTTSLRPVKVGNDGRVWLDEVSVDSYDVAPEMSPDGSKVAFMSDRLGSMDIWVCNADGTGPTPLTTSASRDIHPSWNPGGTQVVFASDRSGNFDIWKMNADGTGAVQVTAGPYVDTTPSWSADGSKIVFERRTSPVPDIYIMNADGSGVTPVANSSYIEREPALSPDGSKVAYISDADPYSHHLHLWVANSDGTSAQTVTLLPDGRFVPGGIGHPSWSPDGTELLFNSALSGQSDIWRINVDGSNPRKLTTNPMHDGAPSWSRDGASIAFNSSRSGMVDIYVMGADGSSQQRLTQSVDDFIPDVNRDSSRIAFASNRARGYAQLNYTSPVADIFLADPDGTNLAAATDLSFYSHHPSFSPDGSQLAFTSVSAGSRDVWKMNLDGTGAVQLTSDVTSESVPTWGDSGKIVYGSDVSANDDIWAMADDGSAQTRLTSQAIHETFPDINTSGTRVAFSSGGTGAGTAWNEVWLMNADGSGLTQLSSDPAVQEWHPSFSPSGRRISYVRGNDLYTMGLDGTVQTRLTYDAAVDTVQTWGADGRTMVFSTSRTSGTNASKSIWRATLGSELDTPNHPPVADAGGPYGGSEGQGVEFDGSASSDPDGDEITYSWDFDGDGATDATGVHATHVWRDDYAGTVTLTVSDGEQSTSDTAEVQVANLAPDVTHFDPGSDPFEGQVAYVRATFADDGADDTHAATIDWGDGTPVSFFDVAISPLEGSHTYIEDGVYTVTVTVIDDDGGVGTGWYMMTVKDVNRPPVAEDLSISTAEDVAAAINLGASDPDGDDLAYSISGGPAHGVLSGEPPNLTYTPDLNYNQGDSFTYTACDGKGGSDSATVSINIDPVNDAPVLDPIADVVTDEGSPASLSISAQDPDGDVLTLLATQLPGFASFVDNGDGTGILSLDPGFDDAGTCAFGVSASDGQASAEGGCQIIVNNTNRPPSADDLAVALDEDVATPITLVGSDPDGETLAYMIVSPPSQGVLLGTGPEVTYLPLLNSNGIDSFTYMVTDGSGATDTGVVSLTINAANDSCSAADDAATVDEDDAVAIDVLANDTDPDGDTLAVASVTQGAHGSVTVGADGTVTYTPERDYNGEDSFTYTVTDGHGGSGTGNVAVTVNPVNDPPIADAGADRGVNEGTAVTLAGSGSDADGDVLTYGWMQVSGPPVELANAQSPTASFAAPEVSADTTFVFELAVSDGQAGATDQVTITVRDVPPIAFEEARSKGYWKNHAQHLGQMLAKGPIDLGDTIVTSVSQAVSILADANTKDARYSLRAQLLATELNLRNGSDPNALGLDIRPVASQAKAFLATHPNPVGSTSPDRTTCVALKDQLDAYNNSEE